MCRRVARWAQVWEHAHMWRSMCRRVGTGGHVWEHVHVCRSMCRSVVTYAHVWENVHMLIGDRTFAHASRACESARVYCTCPYSCLSPTLINLNFPTNFQACRTSISHVPKLVYIPLNMSIYVRTFTHAYRSFEGAREPCTCSYPCTHASRPSLINLNFPQTSKHAHKYITCS